MRKKLTLGGLTSLVIAALVSTSAFATTIVQVGTLESGGWTLSPDFTDNRNGGILELSPKYAAPDGYGVRSLNISTIDNTAKAQLAHLFPSPIDLSGVDELGYSTYRSSDSTAEQGQLPTITIAIDYNGIDGQGGVGDGGAAILTFEPSKQVGGASAVQNNVWQNWSAVGDATWSSNVAIPGIAEAHTSQVSWASILASNPSAILESYIINQGTDAGGLLAAVDAFNFDGTIYDFEGKPYAATTMAECRDGAWVNTYVTVYRNLGDCISSVAPVRY